MLLRILRRILLVENQLQIEGVSAERFINLCVKNNIQLEEVKRTEECVRAVAVGFCEDRIRELADKAGTEVVIMRKRGLLYLFLQNRFRIIFYLMPPAVLITLWILSGYIWSIEVTGIHSITQDVLFDYLAEEGWYYGNRIDHIVPEEVEEQLRIRFPVITWSNVVVRGTCLKIDIKENDFAGNETETDRRGMMTPGGDIVAARRGTVVSIITRSGIPLCKAGDSVEKGQILVRGEIPIYSNTADEVIDRRCVPADADIVLQYEISYFDFVPEEICVKEYTGRRKEVAYFMTLQRRWQLGGTGAPYDTCDPFSVSYQLKCMDNFYLPFFYGKIEYRETTFHNVYRDDRQIREILEKNYEAYLEALSREGIEVIEDEKQYIRGTNGMYLSGRLLIRAPGGRFAPAEQSGEGLPEEETDE